MNRPSDPYESYVNYLYFYCSHINLVASIIDEKHFGKSRMS